MFGWGKWTDISVGSIHDSRYLLQARRHKNGKVQFRVEHASSAWLCDVKMADMEKVKSPEGK